MIQLYTGVPGAGKSYKMVADLDAFLRKQPDIDLVSNISELRLPHLDFDKLLTDSFPDAGLTLSQRLEKFFDYDFQASLNDEFKGPVMYVLDECQLYFPRRTSLPVTEAYLQRHRHLGHSLYLATQSSKLLNSNIVTLIEVEHYAVRGSVSFFGEFHYRTKSPMSSAVIKSFVVWPKKRIFDLYKSFENEALSKPKKDIWLKLWPLLILVVGIFSFYSKFFSDPAGRAARMAGVPLAHAEEVLGSSESRPMPSPQRVLTFEGQQKIDDLRSELEKLRDQMNNTERVFLTVVKYGNKRLTIDPDTGAIVELRKIKQRIFCGDDGFGCYYDRPVNSGVKPAQISPSGGNPAGFSLPYRPSVVPLIPPVKVDSPTGFSTPFKPEEIPDPDIPIKRVEF